MIQFKSFLAPSIEDFIYFRKSSGNWNISSYEPNLKLFDAYVAENYPNDKILLQEMADIWCHKRTSEMNNSCRSRIYVVISFIKYLRERQLTDVMPPEAPKKEKRNYIPHDYTDDELDAFFRECDSIRAKHDDLAHKLHQIIIPVFFRLLFSSGIRTIEARLLKRKDVSFEIGVISIRDTKGDDQHYVVMHDTMNELMQRYDEVTQKLIPERNYFFPSAKDTPHGKGWVIQNFQSLWKKVSTEKTTAYELRHHYATRNINQWIGDSFSFFDKLTYLSMSMGHRSIDETKAYFSIVPAFPNILTELTENSMDDIIPEVKK